LQDSPCEIPHGQSGNEKGFPLKTSVFPCQLPSHTYAHMHTHTHIPVLLDKKTESVRVIQMGITVHIQVVVTLHGQTVTTATSRMDQTLHSDDPPPPRQINGVRLNSEPSKYMSPTT